MALVQMKIEAVGMQIAILTMPGAHLFGEFAGFYPLWHTVRSAPAIVPFFVSTPGDRKGG
jgi:hypothetical protein